MKKVILFAISVVLCTTFLNAQFTTDPGENTQLSDLSGEQTIPKIATCSDGSMYVSWFSNESGNYNMRLQYLDENGNPQWENNGLLISNEDQMSWLTDYSLCTDPANHAIVTFQDIREGGNNNPVGYRVSPTGEMMWGETGILLSNNANFEADPVVSATELGNVIFAWPSLGDIDEVHMQKLSANGDPLWGDGIVLTESGISYRSPKLISADGDYAYLIWNKETGPFWSPNRGLYVQKLDTDGSFMWAEDVEIFAPVASGAVAYLDMCRDDDGGIVFTWYNNDVGTHFNCWVQHMAADGSLSMPANGVVVSTLMTQNHMYPTVAFLPETNEVIAYFSEQDLNQNMRGLYAQKFDMQGNRLWTDDGKQLIPLSDNDYSLPQAGGFADKAICIYGAYEFGNVVDAKVQAVMLNSNGEYVWGDEFIDMSTVQSSKGHRVFSQLNSGQWVAVWGDERNGNRDIYAQNIHPDGSLGPGAVQEGKIQGFVRDAVTNVAIESASITATNMDDSYQTSETPFGSHFSFMVPAGMYNLTCEATGYQVAEAQSMEVIANQNLNYTFYLEPVDQITSTEMNALNNLQFYPNPVKDQLNFSVPQTFKTEIKVTICDIRGSIIKQFKINPSTINMISLEVSDLNPGFYSFSIITNQNQYQQTFIKN